mgnify:CR=1 FL=1
MNESGHIVADTAARIFADLADPQTINHTKDGSWREPSVLVRGIARAKAVQLGRKYGQNAIVFVPRGGAAELVEVPQ